MCHFMLLFLHVILRCIRYGVDFNFFYCSVHIKRKCFYINLNKFTYISKEIYYNLFILQTYFHLKNYKVC